MKLKVNFRNAIGRLIEGIKLKHSRNHQQTYLLNLNKFPFHPPLGPKFFFLFFFLGPNKKVWHPLNQQMFLLPPCEIMFKKQVHLGAMCFLLQFCDVVTLIIIHKGFNHVLLQTNCESKIILRSFLYLSYLIEQCVKTWQFRDEKNYWQLQKK